MADFQTNQQKKDLVRSEFVKSCNTVNGTISFEQTKSILKTIGFDISSIKIEKLVIDQDVDGLNQIDFEGILNILNNLLATNKSEDNDDESGSVDEVEMAERKDEFYRRMWQLSSNGVTITLDVIKQLAAELKIPPPEI
ncbi:unnamed protein product [Rotaria magnacalcarata]|uniref:Uncharacterized protein n=2 Tax=Rotaria magnacalcarata TaxID=392030 RepID=A0A8S2PT77_9BILA|nr:unnamed protein product [Rotaria magnacalcarata]CAF4071318.1 unnamed protein product [Rotaria magnacalcarata]